MFVNVTRTLKKEINTLPSSGNFLAWHIGKQHIFTKLGFAIELLIERNKHLTAYLMMEMF